MSKKVSQPNRRNKAMLNLPLLHTPVRCWREDARPLVRSIGYRLMSGLITRRNNRLVRRRASESIERELTSAGRTHHCSITVWSATAGPHATSEIPRQQPSNYPIDLPPDLPPCRPPHLIKVMGTRTYRRSVDRLFARRAHQPSPGGVSWI